MASNPLFGLVGQDDDVGGLRQRRLPSEDIVAPPEPPSPPAAASARESEARAEFLVSVDRSIPLAVFAVANQVVGTWMDQYGLHEKVLLLVLCLVSLKLVCDFRAFLRGLNTRYAEGDLAQLLQYMLIVSDTVLSSGTAITSVFVGQLAQTALSLHSTAYNAVFLIFGVLFMSGLRLRRGLVG
jgi:hypothetical protein